MSSTFVYRGSAVKSHLPFDVVFAQPGQNTTILDSRRKKILSEGGPHGIIHYKEGVLITHGL